jgi:hypothetical protein
MLTPVDAGPDSCHRRKKRKSDTTASGGTATTDYYPLPALLYENYAGNVATDDAGTEFAPLKTVTRMVGAKQWNGATSSVAYEAPMDDTVIHLSPCFDVTTSCSAAADRVYGRPWTGCLQALQRHCAAPRRRLLHLTNINRVGSLGRGLV